MSTFTHGLGRASEGILRDLRERIQKGEYRPGEKLPTETELCERYELSRSTVRRAVARLVDEGLIRVRKRAGMFVCDLPNPRLTDASRTIALMSLMQNERLKQAQAYAVTNGCLLSTYFQFERYFDAQAERAFLENVKAERYRALLAVCTPLSTGNNDLLDALSRQGTRVIHLEPYFDGLPAEEFLMPDYRAAGHQAAVEGLLRGYDHFFFAGMHGDGPWARQQLAGFASALKTHGSGFKPETQFFNYPRGEDKDNEERLAGFVKNVPENSIIHCRSAHLAEELCRKLEAEGRSIPGSVGVSASDSNTTSLHSPVDLFGFNFEEILMEALVSAVTDSPRCLRKLIPPTHLRSSTLRRITH